MSAPPFWHGGAPGLVPGQLILPPSITGTRLVLSAYMGADGVARSGVRADRVYVATVFEAAAMFAAMHPQGGWVYLVQPLGTLEADPDCDDPTLSRACERALILESLPLDAAEVVRILESVLSGGPT